MATEIYTGRWTNRSYGSVYGDTYTLSPREGAYLTAGVATFVTIVIAQLWKIVLYTLFYLRNSSKRKDGLFHQRQVVFRNSNSPASVLWLSILQAQAWHGKVKSAILRCTPWILITLVYIFGAATASVFSPRMVDAAGPERLLQNHTCSRTSFDATASRQQQAKVVDQLSSVRVLAAANYARQCYGQNSSGVSTCDAFPQSQLSWNGDNDVSCPFAEEMCLRGDSSVYQMLTAKLDSHADLGINAPVEERLKLQKRTTCAPITQEGYYQLADGSQVFGNGSSMANDTFYEYFYGVPTGTGGNYTFRYNTHTRTDEIGYVVSIILAHAGLTHPSWLPIDPLNRTDADVSLVMISFNGIFMQEPCDDPIFAAHNRVNEIAYLTDNYVGIIGCAEQYMLCDAAGGGTCSPWMGQYQLADYVDADVLGLNDAQKSTAVRIIWATDVSAVVMAASQTGRPLEASNTLFQLMQAPLPSNQWQIEVAGWFNTGLAAVQQGIREMVVGLPTPVNGTVQQQFNDPKSCNSQLTRETQGTKSFSVLGLGLTFGIGLLVMLASISIEPGVRYVRTFRGSPAPELNSWLLNDKLHLHRIACSAHGLGNWSRLGKTIPTTEREDEWVDWRDAKQLSQALSEAGDSGTDADQGGQDVHSDTGVALTAWSQTYTQVGAHERV